MTSLQFGRHGQVIPWVKTLVTSSVLRPNKLKVKPPPPFLEKFLLRLLHVNVLKHPTLERCFHINKIGRPQICGATHFSIKFICFELCFPFKLNSIWHFLKSQFQKSNVSAIFPKHYLLLYSLYQLKGTALPVENRKKKKCFQPISPPGYP